MLDNHNAGTGAPLHSLGAVLAKLERSGALDDRELHDLRNSFSRVLRNAEPHTTSDELLAAESIFAFTFRPTVNACLELWFGKSARTDSDIWQRFSVHVTRATCGDLDHWAEASDHPRMLLALIILLDQFRRNMFRDTPDMYAADSRCLELTKRAIRHGVVAKLSPIERVFPCLVLTHSEALEDQHLCMEEWADVEAKLTPTDPLRVFHEVFQRHVSVIEEFGRFPHRNALLGRESSPAELRFLNDADFRFDLPLVKSDDGSFSFQGKISGRHVEHVAGEPDKLAFYGTDHAMAQAEKEIRDNGYCEIEDVVLRKFIIERDMPGVGSLEYCKMKTNIDNANRAMDTLWPRIAWIESYVCNDKTYYVYLADDEATLAEHAFLTGMPLGSVKEVRSIIDPKDYERDLRLDAQIPGSAFVQPAAEEAPRHA